MISQQRNNLESQAIQQLADIYAEEYCVDDHLLDEAFQDEPAGEISKHRFSTNISGWGSPVKSKREKGSSDSPKKPARNILSTLGDNLERYHCNANAPKVSSLLLSSESDKTQPDGNFSSKRQQISTPSTRACSLISNTVNCYSKYFQPTTISNQLHKNSLNLSVSQNRRTSAIHPQFSSNSANNNNQATTSATIIQATAAAAAVNRQNRIETSLYKLRSPPCEEQQQQFELNLKDHFEYKNDMFKSHHSEFMNQPSYSTQYTDALQPKDIFHKIKSRASSASRWTSRPKTKDRSPDLSFSRQRKILQEKMFPSSFGSDEDKGAQIPLTEEPAKKNVNIFPTQYMTAKQLTSRDSTNCSVFSEKQSLTSPAKNEAIKISFPRYLPLTSTATTSSPNQAINPIHLQNQTSQIPTKELSWFSSVQSQINISENNLALDKTPQRIFILRLENTNSNRSPQSTIPSTIRQRDQFQQNRSQYEQLQDLESPQIPRTSKPRNRKIISASPVASVEDAPDFITTETSLCGAKIEPGNYEIAHKSFKQYNIPVAIRTHLLNKRFDGLRKSLHSHPPENKEQQKDPDDNPSEIKHYNSKPNNYVDSSEEQIPKKATLNMHRTSSNMNQQLSNIQQELTLAQPTGNDYQELLLTSTTNRFISKNPLRSQLPSNRSRSISQRGTSTSQIIKQNYSNQIEPTLNYHIQ